MCLESAHLRPRQHWDHAPSILRSRCSVAFEHDDGGGDACVVGNRDKAAADAQALGVGVGGAQKRELRRAAGVGADLDVVPPDVGLTAEGFGGGFLGREAAGEGQRAIWTMTQVRALVLGQDALPQAITETRKRSALTRDGRHVDAQPNDHSALDAGRPLREPALDGRAQVANGAIESDEHGVTDHGVADVQLLDLGDGCDREHIETREPVARSDL